MLVNLVYLFVVVAQFFKIERRITFRFLKAWQVCVHRKLTIIQWCLSKQ